MENYKKKYEQLAKFIKDLYPFMSDYCKEKTEGMFPELKESEGEKIRKEIRDFICWAIDRGSITKEQKEQSNSWIAWLEKQGEQSLEEKVNEAMREVEEKAKAFSAKHKGETTEEILAQMRGEQRSADNVEPKFEIGDFIINEYGFIMQIDGIDSNMYVYHVLDDNRLLKHDITKTEKSCHLWTIQDAKDGDVLAHGSCVCIFILKDMENKFFAAKTYLFKDEFHCDETLYFDTGSIRPATKEQCNLLFQKMKEAGYKWDVEKKELKLIECKLAWSEEDEVRLTSTIQKLEYAKSSNAYNEYGKDSIIKNIDWLQSLKQRMK